MQRSHDVLADKCLFLPTADLTIDFLWVAHGFQIERPDYAYVVASTYTE